MKSDKMIFKMLNIVIVSSPQIVIIEHKSIICSGYNAVLHIHTCIEEVQIVVRERDQNNEVFAQRPR